MSNTVKLADNIPVAIDVKYCDVFPPGPQYPEDGPRLRFKGVIDGAEDSVLYVSADHGLDALVEAGLLVKPPALTNIPEKGLSLKLVDRHITVLRSKGAGERRTILEIYPRDGRRPGRQAKPEALKGGNGAPAAASTTPEPTKASLGDAYLKTTRWVLTNVRPLYEGAGLTFPSETCRAIVATLLIDARDRGAL